MTMSEEKKRWVKETLKMLKESDVFLAEFTSFDIDDPKFSVDFLIELSLSIMLDKPIFLLLPREYSLNEHLSRVLDDWEFYEDETEESIKRAMIGLKAKIEKYFEERHEKV